MNSFTPLKNYLRQILLFFIMETKGRFSLMRLGKKLQVSMEKDSSVKDSVSNG